jgi:hypothetical protein
MSAADYRDFARAVREKLLREIEVKIGEGTAVPTPAPS